MKFELLPHEFWYGGCITWGIKMPLSKTSRETFSLIPTLTPTQGMPLLLSSCGRILWLDGVS